MQAITGLFFDLDGTLCDTDEANFAAYAAAFQDEGVTISRSDFAKTTGLSSAEFIPLLAPGVSSASAERIKAHKREYYPQSMHLVKPRREIIDFLRLMRPLHVTALVTTAQRENAEHVLRAAGLEGLFDHLVFGADVPRMKPAPDAYLKALKLSKLSAEDVIAFEDSDAGVAAANAAGLRVIRVAPNER